MKYKYSLKRLVGFLLAVSCFSVGQTTVAQAEPTIVVCYISPDHKDVIDLNYLIHHYKLKTELPKRSMTYMELATILNVAMDQLNDRLAESTTYLASIDRSDIDKLKRLQMHLSPELIILRGRLYNPEPLKFGEILKPYEQSPRKLCNE